MKLIIKELQGREIEVNVSNESTVAEIKSQIESQLNLPASQQKLLYLGKILQDQNTIQSYNLKDSSKLMLTKCKPLPLDKLIANHFQKSLGVNEETSVSMSRTFMDQMKKKLNNCSLDDIERIANSMFSDKI